MKRFLQNTLSVFTNSFKPRFISGGVFLLAILLANYKASSNVILDQSCNTGSSTGWWAASITEDQTFVPSQNGTLFRVRVQTATYSSSTTILLRIFAGNTPGSGTLLASVNYPKPANTNSWDDIILPGPGVPVTAGTTYYIEIQSPSAVDWIATSTDSYSPGQAWRAGAQNFDFNFETYLAVPTCAGVSPGPNQSGVISNTASSPLGLNPNGDPGAWTTSGTGSFADPHNPNTTYTPSCGEAGNSVTLTWTSSCDFSTYTQTINVAPPGFVVNSATICSGQSATLTGANASTYSWSANAGGATTASVLVTPSTTTVYTVTGTQANGCAYALTPTVTVHPTPGISISGPGTVCSGAGLNNPLSGTGGASPYTFQWIAGNNSNTTGESYSTAVSSSVINDVIINTSGTAQTLSYTITVSDGNGCTNNQLFSVVVNTNPIVTAPSGPSSACVGNPVNYTVSGTSGSTYLWNFGDGNTATTQNSTHTFTASGTYTVSCTVSNTGCSSIGTLTTTINPAPVFTVGSSSPVCSGSSLGLTSTTTGGGSSFTYQWNGPGLFSSTLANPIRPGVLVSHTGYYLLTVNNEFGCSTTDSTYVNVLPTPSAYSTGGPNAICPYESATFSGATSTANGGTIGTYQWLQGSTPVTGATNVSYTTNTPGGYYLVVTNTNGCKDTSLVSPLVVYAKPTSTVTGPSSFCTGQSFSLDGSTSIAGGSSTISGYSWLLNGTATAATTVNPTFSIGGGYQLIVTNSNSCSDTSTVFPVTAINPPTPPLFTLSSNNICYGDTATAIVTSPNANYTYAWTVSSPPLTITSPTNTTTGIIGDVNGMHYVRLIATDTNGCTSFPDSMGLNVTPLPVVAFSLPSSDTICYNGAVAVGIQNSGMAAYEWTSSYGATANTQNPTFTNIQQTGTVTFYGAVTDAVGCKSAVDSLSIFVVSQPTINAGSDVAVCAGAPITLNATGAPGTITWNNGVSNGVPFVPTTSGNYVATISNSFGCTASDSIVVTINPLPSPQINLSATVICVNSSVTAQVQNPVSGNTYSWSSGSGLNISAPSANNTLLTPANQGSYTIFLTETNPVSSCSAKDSLVLNANPLPIVNITGPTTVCSGISITLHAGGANSYLWSNSSTADSIIVTPATNTTYTVTGTDVNNCTNTATQNVSVSSSPSVSASPSANNICPGSSVTLSAGGASTYTWSNGASGASISVTPVITTSFTVTGTAGGCSGTGVVVVNVLPKDSTPVASATSNTVCLSGSVAVSSNITNNNHWFNGASPGTIINNQQSFSPSFTSAGTYNFGVYVQQSGNCSSDTAYVTITVNSCGGSSLTTNNTVANSPVSGTMFPGGNPGGLIVTTSPVTNPTHGTISISSNGSYFYTPNIGFSGFDIIIVQTCNSSSVCNNDTIFITVHPFAGYDHAVVSGLIENDSVSGNVLINDIGSGLSGNVTLMSGPSNGTLSLGSDGYFVYYPDNGYCGVDSFAYQVCDSNGLCVTSVSVIDIECNPKINPHNAFSPNNDGKNDTWIIEGIDLTENNVVVYDRWGNEVWDGTNYDNTNVVWDGTNKSGTSLPQGTYFYWIKIKDKPPLRSWIELTK